MPPQIPSCTSCTVSDPSAQMYFWLCFHIPPPLPSLSSFCPALCTGVWVPCRAAPGFAHSSEPCRASLGCSQLAALMSELTNPQQGIKQKLGSPCSRAQPSGAVGPCHEAFSELIHGCMQQPRAILNHGTENPLWLSPSTLQRDDKPVSSITAFFSFLSFPLLFSPTALRMLSGHPSTLCFPGTLPMITAHGIPQPHCGTAHGTKVHPPCRPQRGGPPKLAAGTGFA